LCGECERRRGGLPDQEQPARNGARSRRLCIRPNADLCDGRHRFRASTAGLSPPSTFDAATKFGWTAGAGVEFAFFGNWSAKAEYLFVDLAAASCSTAANCGSATGSSVAFTENVVRGGFNYRFPW
jgi:outer membrane immunogenic protein